MSAQVDPGAGEVLREVIRAAAPKMFADLDQAAHFFGCQPSDLVGRVHVREGRFMGVLQPSRMMRAMLEAGSDREFLAAFDNAVKQNANQHCHGQKLLIFAGDERDNIVWLTVLKPFISKGGAA